MNTLLKVLCAEGYHKSLLGWEEESQSIKLNQIYVKSFTVKIHFCPCLLIPRTSREAQGWCIERGTSRHQSPPEILGPGFETDLDMSWTLVWSCWMESLLLWGHTRLVYPLCKKEIKHIILALTKGKIWNRPTKWDEFY